eukprot:NODE_4886_length_1834_cov_3.632103.p1 GENE.NODE_4886_length_1834_cov_3.632103~~NODE_4886_length_1834_cov_3.632103.p1  ORF type:complete len:543 (-),score=156.77 NODE_4886_length_1834_cov_3.632103:204-1727(-)
MAAQIRPPPKLPDGGTHLSQNFLTGVLRTSDNFGTGEDTAVEDVRRILLETRQHYDAVHREAERKDEKLRKVKDAIRVADTTERRKQEETSRLEEVRKELLTRHEETKSRIHTMLTSRKVYEHMLARMQKEQAILKQKMLKMEQYLARKSRELGQTKSEAKRLLTERICRTQDMAMLKRDHRTERGICGVAREVMEMELDRKKGDNQDRAELECWRHRVALEAANEAFNASAGRLRKLCAIEKLAGNMLQETQNEHNHQSAKAEEGFKKLREVTGLDEDMDIDQKLAMQQTEHDDLSESVKEAECRLVAMRRQFESVKKETEGLTFDPAAIGHTGDMYKEVEAHEQSFNDALKEHEGARARLQRTTMQVQQMKRWTARVGDFFMDFEEPVPIDSPKDLPGFFRRLDGTIKKFIDHVDSLIADERLDYHELEMVIDRQHNHQEQLLGDRRFLEANCRVDRQADVRPVSRQSTPEDRVDPTQSMATDREKYKGELNDFVKEKQKKRVKG